MLSASEYFKFRVGNLNYVFHRDSFGILQIPKPPLTKKVENEIKNLLKFESNKSRKVGPLALRTIALNLTNNCNFACDYCFANQGAYDKPGLVMSDEIATKAIALLFRNILENHQKRVAIAFFGGEPLLSWQLIRKVVTYAKKNKPKGVRLKFLITTNAFLMTPEVVKFFQKNKFSVMVSIDGNRKAHNLHRKLKNGNGTYDLVIKNILYANKFIPLTFRATITDDNLDLVKIVKHFKRLGATMITLGVDNDHLKKLSYQKLSESYKKLANYYYKDIASRRFYEITNFTEIMLQIVFKEKKVSHCNAGLSYLGVSADGSLYKCPRFTGYKDHKFGEIGDSGNIVAKRNYFVNQLKNSAGDRNISCLACPFVFMCGGLCHYDLFKKGKGDSEVIADLCSLRKTIYSQVFRLYTRIPEEIKKDFFNFLSK